MISVNNLSIAFGADVLFDDISFLISPGNRIGLIGRNGAGKSTLLKFISGDAKPDTGSVSIPNGSTIGILKQDILQKKGISIWNEVRSSFTEIIKTEKKLEKVNEDLITRTDYESDSYLKLIEDLNELTDKHSLLGGYTIDEDMEKVLIGLGFVKEQFEMSVETFSGGWKMRLELAKLLLQNHALMLLDEPTNHLDIESIIWLEGFLIERNATLILVSHDIEFLNRVTNRTIEISLGRIYDHMGNYTKFIEWRKEVKEKQIQSKKNQDKKIAETKQLIEKFRAKASKAAFAQSLIKKMNKMDRIEVDEDDTRSMHFRFPKTERAGQKIVIAKSLSKSYDDNLVLNEIDLELLRGEKIAFVGQNGQGKSTLIKLITKEITGKGHIELGHNVQLGYYAQDQTENITDNRTVLKTVEDAAPDNSGNIARKLLGAFMFSGEDVEKKARVLSGGERARLAMCQLMLKPINFLVMDEPTNHLDIISKQTLKKALKDFDGTLLVVSHDRAFLEGLVEKTYEFRDSKLIEYLGGIEYFLEKRKVDSMREVEQRSKEKLAKKKGGKNDHQIRKENDKQARKKQNRIKKLEADIGTLETEISSQEVDLKDPNKFQDISTDNTFFTSYEDNKKTLEKLMKEWEGLIE